MSVNAPATEQFFGFQVFIPTNPPAADTDVTITATDGRYTFSTILTVRAAAPAPVLSGVSVNPTSVVGGNPSTGTVTLSAPQSGATVVALSTPVPASVATMPVEHHRTGGRDQRRLSNHDQAGHRDVQHEHLCGPRRQPRPPGALAHHCRFGTATAATTAPAAPTLVAPAANATPAQPVAFDWTDVTNAASYEIQIDDSSTMSAPFVASATVAASQTTIGSLPAQQLWWRVRARNSAGVAGAFSSTRSFTPTSTAAQPVPLTVTATGRSGERVTSSPSGINVAVGSLGHRHRSPRGPAITLSVSNGRDAIWSGACSSGGNKRRTCTFTITGTASVTANVQ